MAQQVLGGIGAAVGYYIGGPTGAQYGWMIGSAIGSVVDPTVLPGPRIGEIAQQTSQEGVPRPIVFALSPPMPGNIIASSEPKIVRRKESQGKGGPKVETESVYRTYAVGVCEGLITRFVRVWRNGILVYDVSDNSQLDEDSEIVLPIFGGQVIPSQNSEFLKTARFFLGGWNQQPSPDLESIFGVGTTPAHRGSAYMVMADEDLTDMRGAIPQYMFQVERCEGVFLTSRPYSLELIEAMDVAFPSTRSNPRVALPDEAVNVTFALTAGEMRVPLIDYDDWPTEAIDVTFTLTDGALRVPLIDYDDWPPEAVDIAFTLADGRLYTALLTYDNYDPEAMDISFALTGGTLT